jgi:hypothetical protein
MRRVAATGGLACGHRELTTSLSQQRTVPDGVSLGADANPKEPEPRYQHASSSVLGLSATGRDGMLISSTQGRVRSRLQVCIGSEAHAIGWIAPASET